MYRFPEHFYTDVRIEEVFDTKISFKKGVLQEQKVRRNIGAFIRVFDGSRWYYSATTNIDHIQDKIDALAEMGIANPEILEHPIVKRFQTNRETIDRKSVV